MNFPTRNEIPFIHPRKFCWTLRKFTFSFSLCQQKRP
jgi:hypothetical protein